MSNKDLQQLGQFLAKLAIMLGVPGALWAMLNGCVQPTTETSLMRDSEKVSVVGNAMTTETESTVNR